MSYLLTLVSRYSYAKIAARFNVTQTYLRAITSAARVPTPRIIKLASNLYRTSQYNRMKAAGINAVEARAWRGKSIDFIDSMTDRYKVITRQIAEQRQTTMAAISRSLSQTDYNIEELEERYVILGG